MRWILTAAALVFAPAMTAADSQAVAPVTPAVPICGAQASAPPAPAEALLDGYGTGGFMVRTRSAEAQAYFDNGMQLGHAFAHKASVAAFRKAEQLDPSCAMCAWGEAWARGPTLNYPIDDKTQAALAALADRAAVLAKDGPDKERRLAAALRLRYHDGGARGPGDFAYARAMDAIARAAPDDNELAILAADAWMIPTAHRGGRANLDRALAFLEPALRRKPDDTGAIHFYIHATELDGVPGRATPYAERLEQLAPRASHLVHMPSHTFFWVGRYADAARANLDAVAVDEANLKRLKLGDDPFSLTYHGHNVAFGIGAAMMDGDAAAAMALARPLLAELPKLKPDPNGAQFAAGKAYFVEGRYGDQAEVAALPDPGPAAPYARAMWRYARGEAAARRGDARAVAAEAEKAVLSPADLKALGDASPIAQTLVGVARLTLVGRAAMLDGHPQDAARAFAKAASQQEAGLKDYTDPPAWWYPARRSLAAAQLAMGRAAEAERQARAVLARSPLDPVTLAILARAERAQGRDADAQRDLAEARRGWRGEAAALGLEDPARASAG